MYLYRREQKCFIKLSRSRGVETKWGGLGPAVGLFRTWLIRGLKMQLHIRGQSTHVLDVNGEETIGQIKERILALAEVGAEEVTLSLCGAPVEDSCLVSELSSNELDLTIPLLGGKVHGSLARAGKVKGQTPKVEKQQKKKKKTGRAKRRIQYNRRFVNVVQTFGRRRGPNSNS